MRFIEKNFDAPPLELKECAAKYGHKILTYDKKLRTKCCKIIKPHLEKIYYGKCAYCETRSESEVEHYRPFKRYWWLVFEWTNLLLACPICNKKKEDRFPIKYENERITGPGSADSRVDSKTLLGEAPLLLNPELDDPLEHLVYLPQANGKIEIAIQGASEKGKTTIAVLDLNRAWLKVNYKRQVVKIINDISTSTKAVLSSIGENEGKKIQVEEKDLDLLYKLYFITFRELKRLQDPDNPDSMYTYTQLGYHMYEEFDLFILPHLPGNIRNLVKDAFSRFKEGQMRENNPGIKEFKDFQIVIAGGNNDG